MNQESIYKSKFLLFVFATILFSPSFIEAKKKSSSQETAPVFAIPEFEPLRQSYKLCIIIPAYNEEERIEETVHEFVKYFKNIKRLSTTFLIVANNCSDNTVPICNRLQKEYNEVKLMDLKPGGKGFAVKQGFLKAINGNYDLIGFVDADLATQPPYFYELITKIKDYDGAIASRYAKGARVWPDRPLLKKIGGKFYNWILRQRCHIDIKDTQCGAKLFKADTIKTIAHLMEDERWAFDLELLYLARIFDKKIIEVPTTWSDMPGSHLNISGCTSEFLNAPGRIKKRHKQLALDLKKDRKLKKKSKKKK